jgi:YVTN family beta-propeller protein
VPVAYAAPAGNLPAGHLRGATFDAVLPSGRIITPWGESVVVGVDALGVALSPDGRYAIVSCGDAGAADLQSLVDPTATGGHLLAVIDTSTMQIVQRYRAPGETYWLGVAALPDPVQTSRTLVLVSGGPTNVVYAFTLDPDGQLRPDRRHAIAIPSPSDPGLVSLGHASPGMLVASRDGRRVYVVNQAAATVAAIDTRARSVTGPVRSVGFAPFGAAISVDRLLVSDEGLMQYADLAQTSASPSFGVPPPDPQRASALSLLGLAPNGDLSVLASDAPPFAQASVPMDPGPDGVRIAGGAHPTAIAATPDGAYAYVAMSGVDRIATVALDGMPRVVGGTELRLFDRGPYGMQPAALALSRDGARLYVALAGINAIAVLTHTVNADRHRTQRSGNKADVTATPVVARTLRHIRRLSIGRGRGPLSVLRRIRQRLNNRPLRSTQPGRRPRRCIGIRARNHGAITAGIPVVDLSSLKRGQVGRHGELPVDIHRIGLEDER